MVKHDFLLNGTSFPQTDGTRAFRIQKLGKRDLVAKMPLEFGKWQKYSYFENVVSEQNFGISTHQSPYLGVRYLNTNFGVILTLNKKVVQLTQTKETEGCE